MNKTDLIKITSAKTNIQQKDVKHILETAFETIAGGIIIDGKTVISNFGTFYFTEVEAHDGINPKTGEPIIIPKRRVVKFKPGKGLKDVVNDTNNDD